MITEEGKSLFFDCHNTGNVLVGMILAYAGRKKMKKVLKRREKDEKEEVNIKT